MVNLPISQHLQQRNALQLETHISSTAAVENGQRSITSLSLCAAIVALLKKSLTTSRATPKTQFIVGLQHGILREPHLLCYSEEWSVDCGGGGAVAAARGHVRVYFLLTIP